MKRLAAGIGFINLLFLKGSFSVQTKRPAIHGWAQFSKSKNNYMYYTHMFSYNIPKDNQPCSFTDSYINVIATWNGESYYTDGRPMVSVTGVNLSFYDCIKVKDWHKAHAQIEKLAISHFAEIARIEKINQARAILIEQGEPTGIPTLDYFIASEVDLKLQQTLS